MTVTEGMEKDGEELGVEKRSCSSSGHVQLTLNSLEHLTVLEALEERGMERPPSTS